MLASLNGLFCRIEKDNEGSDKIAPENYPFLGKKCARGNGYMGEECMCAVLVCVCVFIGLTD